MRQIKRLISSLLVICMFFSLAVSVEVSAKPEDKQQKKVLFINQTVSMQIAGNGSKKQVKWSSSNKKVVRITSTGKMTGLKKGTAKVKAVNKKSKKVLATYKVTVKSFSEKEIKSKITKVSGDDIQVMKFLGKKYCVVNSKAELEQLKKDICTQYVQKMNGSKAQCKKTAFYKKLGSYKESFFKTKTLCIVEHTQPYLGMPSETGKLTRKQNEKGNVYGKLDVTYLKIPSDKVLLPMLSYQEYFIELNSSDADVLQNYKISVTK